MHVWTGVFSDSLDFDNRKRVFEIKKTGNEGWKNEAIFRKNIDVSWGYNRNWIYYSHLGL